ncbi:hypothetical protein OH77DRAFT_192399 [Trametes cingulata]|nr:hypothetical protein OH77DRAFT_192399 [Trametes cingulata]
MFSQTESLEPQSPVAWPHRIASACWRAQALFERLIPLPLTRRSSRRYRCLSVLGREVERPSLFYRGRWFSRPAAHGLTARSGMQPEPPTVPSGGLKVNDVLESVSHIRTSLPAVRLPRRSERHSTRSPWQLSSYLKLSRTCRGPAHALRPLRRRCCSRRRGIMKNSSQCSTQHDARPVTYLGTTEPLSGRGRCRTGFARF